MNIKHNLLSVAAGATVLVFLGSIGGAVAANQIGSDGIRDGSIRSVDLKNGTAVRLRDLAPGTVAALSKPGPEGAQGPQGPQGPKGDKGDKGEPGDPASDVLGGLAVDYTSDATTLTNIGGRFSERANQVGQVTLQPGTYVVTAEGFFESTAAVPQPYQLMLALRGPGGADFGTCFTGEGSQLNGRDVSCTASKVVTVTDPDTVVDVKAFGYQDNQGAEDSGLFWTVATVSAVKVG